MARIRLGFNCNCFTNRFDEPSEWTRICRSLGVHYVMFNIDLIDPYWPWDLQKRLCDETLNECAKSGVEIVCSFGGHHGHQHYLGHPDPACRREAENFFRRAIRQTAYLGGRSFGTCFAIQTVRTHQDGLERARILDDAVAAYHRLAEYAAGQGLDALAYESTSVPRESCATFAENDDVLDRCSDMAVPLRLCLDLGHRNIAGLPEERDPLTWILRYASRADVVDCQQTDPSGSRHWPFTESHNERGIIRGADVIDALNQATEGAILLAFEIRTAAFYPEEDLHLRYLEDSVKYWREWVAE